MVRYRLRIIGSIFLFFPFLVEGFSQTKNEQKIENMKNSFITSKSQVLATEIKERKVLSALFVVNTRMKKMSKRRNILTNKMLYVKSNVKTIAKNIAYIEGLIGGQRGVLSNRLKAIFKISRSGVLPELFSSGSSYDLDKTLKYLKLYSENDYTVIKSYEKNLKKLKAKRLRLNRAVRKLITVKQKLKESEDLLENEQKAKAKILASLEEYKNIELKKLDSIREKSQDILKKSNFKGLSNLLDNSFYAMKGQLPRPINGTLQEKYGIVQHKKYNYKLSHKGHFYSSKENELVKAVHGGAVVFSGKISGYGMTVIIDHGDHYYTVYANLSTIFVENRETTFVNKSIGKVGISSKYFGNGIYFEIRHFSDAIDPRDWLVANSI